MTSMRTIAHISDLHFGRHNVEVTEHLLASLESIRPDLVVISGDFTQRARQVEFVEARRFLDRIGFAKLVTPGNHDVPLYNLFSRTLSPFRKYRRYIAPLDRPLSWFEDDELAVLALNTARRFTGKNGRLSQLQIASIGRIFAAVPREKTRIIVTHHPLAIPGTEHPVELAGRALAALQAIAEAGIHLLLSGHHHNALSGPATELSGGGSMLIVHAGTAISTRTRGLGGNSYNLIEVARGNVAVRVMKWGNSTGFAETELACYAFDKNRWARAAGCGGPLFA